MKPDTSATPQTPAEREFIKTMTDIWHIKGTDAALYALMEAFALMSDGATQGDLLRAAKHTADSLPTLN